MIKRDISAKKVVVDDGGQPDFHQSINLFTLNANAAYIALHHFDHNHVHMFKQFYYEKGSV